MTFKENDFGKIVLGRQSVRNFDPAVKISHEEMLEMLNEAVQAPSACNLQSWKFVVVDSEAGKEKLRSYFMPFNHQQVNTASAIVLVFGNTKSWKKYEELWNGMAESGKVTKEARDAAVGTFLPLYKNADRQLLVADALVDASLVSMQLMLVARAHGYDTNAMAGYDAKKAAVTFDLDPEQYVPVMAIAIGKGNPDEVIPDTTRYLAKDLTDFA